MYLKGRYYWNRRTEQTLKRAVEYFQQAIDKDPGYARAYAGLADCYGVYISPFDTAIICTGLGDTERAFEWLEKALEDRSWWMIRLKVDPRLDRLRADPRFTSLLRRMGLGP